MAPVSPISKELMIAISENEKFLSEIVKMKELFENKKSEVKIDIKNFFDKLKNQLYLMCKESEGSFDTFFQQEETYLNNQLEILKSLNDEGLKLNMMIKDTPSNPKTIALGVTYLENLRSFKKSITLNGISSADFKFVPLTDQLSSDLCFNKYYQADPFKIAVVSMKQDSENPSQITAYVNKNELIYLHTNASYHPRLIHHLSVAIIDPQEIILPGIRLSDERNGSYFIHYKPTQLGTHLLNVRLYDLPISGSPITINVVKKKNDTRAGVDSEKNLKKSEERNLNDSFVKINESGDNDYISISDASFDIATDDNCKFLCSPCPTDKQKNSVINATDISGDDNSNIDKDGLDFFNADPGYLTKQTAVSISSPEAPKTNVNFSLIEKNEKTVKNSNASSDFDIDMLKYDNVKSVLISTTKNKKTEVNVLYASLIESKNNNKCDIKKGTAEPLNQKNKCKDFSYLKAGVDNLRNSLRKTGDKDSVGGLLFQYDNLKGATSSDFGSYDKMAGVVSSDSTSS
ncbi:hypothetical protein HELRODRAFT_159630 [Helobdella robusta]|uniref:Uncharacterized protein n=1 Tax=Helobdella robusta TaxID=6412 RepID=T1EP96_HELRO|nr:hypothetical protein HELRODRAFT_159630 [Helobdella robusta]ESO13035.1 hypothetical protein HELRODRAFT_159630 [Helobdella robusta]